jgi:hypothetical protein
MRAYLDDIREKPSSFDILWRSYEEAIGYCLENGVPLYISFDHDLGYGNIADGEIFGKTGMDFIKWLVEQDINMNGKFIPACFDYDIHSANPVGAENMDRYLIQYLRTR